MSKNLFIIPCCSRKNPGGNASNAGNTFFENENICTQLISLRNIKMRQSPPSNHNYFMRAWDRYDGVIYRRLKQHQTLIDSLMKNECLDIIIISALYGVINYDTYINDYDLELSANNGISFWGQGNVISNSINRYCENTDVQQIYSFLTPNTYYRGLSANALELNHFQSWPVGIRGATNVLNHVSDQIIDRLNNISRNCSN
jgi:cytoplasmic iron level regulating protein YaaA (DUF328/UPF0246 family)